MEDFNPADHLGDEQPEDIREEDFIAKMKRYGKLIPFHSEVVAAYFAMRDPKVPVKDRGLIAAGIAYLILPFDLMPEAILGPLGLGDDISVLWFVVSQVNHIITDEHRALAADFFA